MSFTGLWKLNCEKTLSQKTILRAMGRPTWQISVIDGANEDFRLLHFTRSVNDKKIHYIEKNVRIFLNSQFLSTISYWLSIPFNEVQYKHILLANGQAVQHADDAKQFGPCTSRTVWTDEGFTIRWYLSAGLLKVTHQVLNNNTELHVKLHFTNHDNVTTVSTKIYDRQPWRPTDLEYIQHNAHAQYLNQT